jgi:hypothetical protein
LALREVAKAEVVAWLRFLLFFSGGRRERLREVEVLEEVKGWL